MADIFEVADLFRAELLRGERAAASALVEAYGQAWGRIREGVERVTARIAAAQAAGEEVSPAWLFQRDRLQALQQQVEREIGRFAQFADERIRAEQAAAVEAAQAHAEALARAGLGPAPVGVSLTWARLPREALTDLVGFLEDGSPLRALLDELGLGASAAVREALVTGLALGQHPTAIARAIRGELGGNLARALTIARTEVLRSYRESSRRGYQANSDIVRGWIWHSAKTTRTCAACWAMHGTFHTLDERLDDHPRGRCAMVPVTRSWAELGFEGVPETAIEEELGVDAFARLPLEAQREILGPAKLAAYRAGAIQLEDVVGRRSDPRWGTMRYERSLSDMLGPDAAQRWRSPVATSAGSRQKDRPDAGAPS